MLNSSITESLVNIFLIQLNVLFLFVLVALARLVLPRWALITLYSLAVFVILLGMLWRS